VGNLRTVEEAMAKGDMTLVDIYVDGADGRKLELFNSQLKLGVPRRRRWFIKERADVYRERVRAALLQRFINIGK
jgi:hypothetical protein